MAVVETGCRVRARVVWMCCGLLCRREDNEGWAMIAKGLLKEEEKKNSPEPLGQRLSSCSLER